MAKTNCWEHKACGRQPGGHKVAELGVCSAAAEIRVDGMNGGCNGGRSCWAVSGTLCGGKVQGTFAVKLASCMHCEFFERVSREEGPALENAKSLLARLKAP